MPLAALVLVCELAGNYDLLVPLMLAQGIAYVALRNRALYGSQVATQRDSPVHRDALLIDVLRAILVKDLMTHGRPFVTFVPQTSTAEMLRHVSDSTWQDVFPVVASNGVMVGETFYVAGHIGIDAATGQAASNVETEAHLVLDAVKHTVEQAGMTMDDLVSVTVYCTDLDLYDKFNAVYRTYFRGQFPARAFIGVNKLVRGARFEVAGVAVKPAGARKL